MNINKLYLIKIGILLCFTSSYSVGKEAVMHNNHNHSINKNTNQDKGVFTEESQQFSCPMHPEIIQDSSGSCPICGMDLVKKQKINNIAGIFINERMQQNMNVKFSETKMKIIKPKIKTYGKIKYNEDTISNYHIRFNGWLEKSYIKNEGQYIKKGEKLFEIYSEELIIAQQDYLLTKMKNSRNLIKSPKTRLRLLGVDERVINNLDKNNKVIYSVPFYSKTSGFIENFNIREGSYVKPNIEMFKLVNKDTLWIDGYIFEDDKNLISIGDKVKINISGSEEYETNIDYIYPELDDETLSLKFRATIENKIKSKNLKPNMIIDITIKTNKKIRGLFIPKESLIQTEYNNRVVVKKGNNFIVKEIIVGYKNHKYAQVLKGLSFKEKVVTSSQFLIDSEASLNGSIIRIGDENE